MKKRSNIFRLIAALVLPLQMLLTAEAQADGAYDFTYTGRLTDSTAKPVAGPVALKATFYHDASGQNPILTVTDGLQAVNLQQGVFQFTLVIVASDYDRVFNDVSQPVWIQITDMTHAAAKPFPLQKLEMTPYAAKIPVDNLTVAFNSEGKLTAGPQGAPGANQFVTKDAGGNFVWATPATSASALQGQTVSATAPAAGQVLKFDGTQWLPTTISTAAGTLTSISGSVPLAITGTAAAPALSITQATSVSPGYLSAADWLTFSAKQPPLGFSPVNKAGDTMTGALNMGGQTLANLAVPANTADAATKGYVDTNALRKDGTTALSGNWAVGGKDVTGLGNVGISAAKTLTLGVFTNTTEGTMTSGLDASGSASPDKGKTWFNSQTNQVKYWDGSAAQSLGVSGAGLTSLGGQTGGAQTFSMTQTGNLPAINSAANVHTISIPLASASASVSAGLISNADYVAFNGKQTSGNYMTALTGDLSAAGPGSAVATLAPSGVSAGTYTKVTVDAKGRVTAASTLVPTDIPNLSAVQITSGTLAASVGGTGVNSTATFPTSGVVVTEGGTETLTNKTLTAPVIGSIVNTGTLTLPTSSDTLVGRATSDTLTNKILTSAIINGATAIATTGTISSGSQTVAGNVTIQGNASTANNLVFNDKGTVHALSFKAPDILTGSVAWTLPGSDGSDGQILTTNGAGTLSWVSGAAATGAAGGDLLGSYPNPTLAASGITAGTYTKVTVDAKGRATAGTSLVAADIPTLPASAIGGIGALIVANGGTGVANLTTNGILLGNGTGNVVTSAAGLAYQSFTVPSGGGTPSFSAINLSQPAAIIGTLPLANGGTGASTAAAALTALGAANAGANATITSLSGLTTALSVGQGGTGLTAAPTSGQIPIGNAGAYTLATLTGGNGITVTNGSGSINIASTVTPANYVAVAGSTMTGVLNLPANGLTAGTSQLVLSGGNVGIGTTSPTRTLDVVGTASHAGAGNSSQVSVRGSSSSSNKLNVGYDTTNNYGYVEAVNEGVVWQNLVLQGSGGNVGIGTTSPAQLLTVLGSVGSPATSGQAQGGVARLSASNSVLDFGFYAASPYAAWIQADNVFNLTNYLPLALQPVGGNVGIGTTSPFGILNVVQSASTAWADTFNVIAPNLATGNTVANRLGQSLSQGNAVEEGFQYAGNNSPSNMFIYAFRGNGEKMHITNGSVFRFGPNLESSTEWMRLTGGNLGIGTTAPAGKLDVAGSICLSGANCITSWPAGSVTSITTGTGLSGGTISGSGTISLANTTVTAGTYARANITVDGQGRLTAASGGNVSLSTEVTSTLPIANGGTGATSATSAFSALSPLSLLGDLIYGGTAGVGTRLAGNATATKLFLTSTGSGSAATAPAWSGLAAGDLPTHSAALINAGSLGVANGGTGLTATPANGQIPIGNTSGYTLATLSGGNGITVTNGSGSINIASTVTPANYVAVAGSTMTGALNLPLNGLIAGSNQLVLAGGNVGIGTAAPATNLEIDGASATGSPVATVDMFTLHRPSTANSSWDQWAAFALGRYVNNSAGGYYPNSRLDIKLNDAVSTSSESATNTIMTLQGNGNVGIGTTAPGAKLQVGGTAGTDGIMFPDGTLQKSAAIGSGASQWTTVSSNIYFNGGNVGIGSTSPVSLLEVGSPTASGLLLTLDSAANSQAGIQFNSAGSQAWYLYRYQNGTDLRFWDGSADRMILKAGGKVGIGTVSPSELLTVNSGSRAALSFGAGGLAVPPTGATTSNGTKIRLYEGQGASSLDYALGTASGELWQTSGGSFTWYTGNGTGTPTQQMVMTSAGNLGIGTATPTSMLNLYSSAYASNIPFLTIGGGGGSGNQVGIQMSAWAGRGGGAATQITAIDDNGSSSHLAFWTADPGNAAALERMRITDRGNVGIGTTTPTHLLEVAGSAANTLGGSWVTISDIRMKKIESDYEYGLAEVKRLHTVRFKYKPGNTLNLPTDQEHTGFIAQEVQDVIPDAVIHRPDGYLELNVDPIHWATVNAVKELAVAGEQKDTEILQLRADTTQLRKRADKAEADAAQLRSETAQLRALVCSEFPASAYCQP